MKPRRKHTVADRVQAYLRTVDGQPRYYANMARALGHTNQYHVRQVCDRLAQDGQIEACGQGYYRVAAQGRRDTEETA